MELEEAKKECIEIKNSFLDKVNSTDPANVYSGNAIETVLQALEKNQNIIENQKFIIQERDKEIFELNQRCILERVAKEEVEELLDNSISKDKVKDEIKLHGAYLASQAVTSNIELDKINRYQERYAIQVLNKLLKE